MQIPFEDLLLAAAVFCIVPRCAPNKKFTLPVDGSTEGSRGTIDTAMALMAPKSIQTVMKYYREVPQEDLRKAVALLDQTEPSSASSR